MSSMASGHLHTEPDWQGVLAGAGLGAFEALMECDLGQCVSEHARGQVSRIELPGGEVVYLKRDFFGLTMLKDALLDVCRLRNPQPACIRELEAIRQVERLAIAVPKPIAWGQKRLGCLPLQSALVTTELPGKQLHRMLKFGAPRDQVRPALQAAGRTSGRLYEAGFSWPDLMPKHFYIDGDSAGLLDLTRAHKTTRPLATYMPSQVARFCEKARFFGTEEEDIGLFLEALGYERLLRSRTGV